jgi:hypothetical protein
MALLVEIRPTLLSSEQEVFVTQAKELLDLLACPKCHGELGAHSAPEGFVCQACRLFYALDDGLPNMLIEEARPWPLPDAPASA